MAANNYFGFTTGGTQYGSTPGQTNYTTGQTPASYTVQHAPQTYSAAATAQQRTSQPTYETYQQNAHSTAVAAAAAAAYPYAARQQTTYEKAQTYYQPQVSYTTAAETSPFQNASIYVQPSAVTQAAAQSVVAQTQVQVIQASTTNSVSTPKVHTNSWVSFKKGTVRLQRPKLPPKPQQFHYCEVCKISCAGPQTYKEHLEGQKHKKKESALETGTVPPGRGRTSLRCELCNIICTGSDAYSAHIRGSKHQKVLKLHTKLGKPIPSTEPQVVNSGTSNSKNTEGLKNVPGKKTGPPKVNFVGSGATKSGTNGSGDDQAEIADEDGYDRLEEKEIQPVGQDYIEEVKNEEGKIMSFQCKLCECSFNDPNAKEMHMKGRRHRLQYKKKVDPELVVDIKPSLRQRKIQEERMRRHHLVDEFWKRREEERWREEMRMMEEEERMYWEERRRYEEEIEYFEWHRRFAGRDSWMAIPPMGGRWGMHSMPGVGRFRKMETVDDRHVVAKHTQIYPKEEELNAVQKIITNSEKALKLVSDFLTEKDAPLGITIKKEIPDTTEQVKEKDEKSENEKCDSVSQQYRVLKGVMRVGNLAKGLVLTGDTKAQLVVMCAEKPAFTLLKRVLDNLPKQLEVVAPGEKYEVKSCIEEGALIVSSITEPKISVTVALTSPLMREPSNTEGNAQAETVKDPPDVLDRQKCLEALAALRHAKWFQAKATPLQSCVMVMRVLRDLCHRNPTWSPLSSWAMELLIEKVLRCAGQPLGPGDALRRVFEAIASGIFLPGSSGLLDPCEKESVDAAANLNDQEREDLTASAQQALRCIAFRQIHKVLGIEPLPPTKFSRGQFPRKRRRDNIGESTDGEGNQNGKKDKKEDNKEAMETAEEATSESKV